MKDRYIFVYRYNSSVEVLKISLDKNSVEVTPSNKIEKSKISSGFYEAENNQGVMDFVALVATPGGPLLILNSLKYSPKIGETKIDVVDEGEFSQFRVMHRGQQLFGLFYEEKSGIGAHPYNENREDVDFYYWLSRNIENPKLYDYYRKDFRI